MNQDIPALYCIKCGKRLEVKKQKTKLFYDVLSGHPVYHTEYLLKCPGSFLPFELDGHSVLSHQSKIVGEL